MNRFLRGFLFAISVLLVAYGVSLGLYFHVAEIPVVRSKILWAITALALFVALVAWRSSARAKAKVFLLVGVFFFLELLLQLLALLGWLPLVDTKRKAPYGRVYWSSEGRGNSIRNRFGWYYPEFDLKAPRRIVLIGDSQVEAVEVHRTRNQAAVLHTLLNQQSPDWSVLGLGSHGVSPAYSIDVLEYAARHFKPREAIVVVSGGSDVTESLPTLTPYSPAQFIFYDLAPGGGIALNPASAGVRESFRRSLEANHGSLLANLPMTLNSHCMTLQLVVSLRDTIKKRAQHAKLAERAQEFTGEERAEYLRLGFNPAPYSLKIGDKARTAMQVLLGELRRCQEICATNKIMLRLVVLPSFPKVFYDSQRGREWTMQIGAYDYFKPEREMAEFARSNSIPVLALGDYIQRQKLDVEEIRSLYLSGGVGHFSEKGHRYCAQAIYETFYRKSSL
jgi:hypothetical protein